MLFSEVGKSHIQEFYRSYLEYHDAIIDFRYFKTKFEEELPEISKNTKGFDYLEKEYSKFVHMSEDGVQLSFANRALGRKDAEGKSAMEAGASLLYRIGPRGEVAVIMSPAHSPIARPFEDHIYLRIGKYSSFNLISKMGKDFRDLVDYAHATSLDGRPNLRQRTRVWWLRLTHPMQVDGKFKTAYGVTKFGTVIDYSAKSVANALVVSMAKPIGLFALLWLLIKYGSPYADYLLPIGR